MPKNYITCLWNWKRLEVQDKVCWLKEMIWAGLTDHPMCKPELFLDNRFQVITLIMVDHDIQCYLEPIVQSRSYCRLIQKVENKSFKSGGQIWISDQRLDQNSKTCFYFDCRLTRRVEWDRHQAKVAVAWSNIADVGIKVPNINSKMNNAGVKDFDSKCEVFYWSDRWLGRSGSFGVQSICCGLSAN